MTLASQFVARDRELGYLEEAYANPGFQFVVIYGRRRIGKTALLQRFITDKRNVFFFTGQRTNVANNLTYLSNAIYTQLTHPQPGTGSSPVHDELAYLDPAMSANAPRFTDFGSALSELFRSTEAMDRSLGRPVVIIDEYPYIAQGDSPVSSILQTLIDHKKERSDIMLVLCGSSLSFMEREVLGKDGPLYGRRTREFELKPMDVFDSAKVLDAKLDAQGAIGSVSPRTIVETYGIAGGVPLYLQQLDPSHSIEENLARNVFDQSKLLFTEPSDYLAQSVSAVENYNAVLTAVANGATERSKIADKAHVSSNTIGTYLKTLEQLRIVRKDTPIPEKSGGRSGFVIIDNLFRAWYRFAVRFIGAIEAGEGAKVASYLMQQEFPTYMGSIFEDVCRQWVEREISAGRIEGVLGKVGRWWGTDPIKREQADIDVVATTYGGPLVLGECKWRREPTDVGVLMELERRSAIFDEVYKRLFVFSLSEFTEGAREYAEGRPSLRLVTLPEIFELEK